MPTEFVDTASSEPKTNLGPPEGSLSFFRLPRELALFVSRTDDALLRLNQLLTTTAGMDYLLSTLNYSSYLLTFLYAHAPSRAKLRLLLSRIPLRSHTSHQTFSKAYPPSDPSSTVSRLANLTTFLTNTRTTLRLTALVPLYAWLRTLLSTSKSPDPYLHAIALTQCLSYIIYQALENVAHLIDLQILPTSSSVFITLRSASNTTTTALSSSTAKIWLLSSRFWLAGVFCDIFRLLREAYVEAQERRRRRLQQTSTSFSSDSEEYQKEYALAAAEAEAADRRWWSELFVAGCWLPLCAHYSVEGGLFRPSMEDGIVGALGLAASWEGWRVAWAETKG